MESNKCDEDVFKNGTSLGIFDMSKSEAEKFCADKTKETGIKHDWHYVMGRVHVKALYPTELLKVIAQRDEHAARIEWIEEVNTLHRKVEFLYVVDGYQATITWDGEAISEDFHGETIAEAIDKAMAGFDLNNRGKNCRTSKREFSEVTQLYAIERQRDELLEALIVARCEIKWLSPRSAILIEIDSAIAKCEVKS